MAGRQSGRGYGSPGHFCVHIGVVKDRRVRRQGGGSSGIAELSPEFRYFRRVGTKQRSPAAAEQAGDGQSERTARLVDLLTKVVTPSAVLLGLIYYASWRQSVVLFRHFGVDLTEISRDTTDYVVRGSFLFVPAVAGLVLIVLSVLAAAALSRIESHTGFYRDHRWLRVITLVLATAFGLIAWQALHHRWVNQDVGAAMLVAAGLLVLGAWRLDRDTTPSKPQFFSASVATVVVLMGAFWATTIYADNMGAQNARYIAAEPANRLPSVTIISSQRLPSVVGTWVSQTGQGWKHEGFSVLTYGGKRWFLIPTAPQPHPKTLLISDEDKILSSIQFLVSPPGGFRALPRVESMPNPPAATAVPDAQLPPPGIPPLSPAAGPQMPFEPRPGKPPAWALPRPEPPLGLPSDAVIWDSGERSWGIWLVGNAWMPLS